MRDESWVALLTPTAESDVLDCISAALDHRRSLLRVEPTVEPWRRLLVGESAAMRNAAGIVRLIAARRSTVLISGGSETGRRGRYIWLGTAPLNRSVSSDWVWFIVLAL